MGLVSMYAGLLVSWWFVRPSPTPYQKPLFLLTQKGLTTMNSKKPIVIKPIFTSLYCPNCGNLGLTDLILRDDDICHCLECEHEIIKWSDLADNQKEMVHVPVLSTSKLAFTRKLADVFLELADMPAKEMRDNLRKLALVLNQVSAIAK